MPLTARDRLELLVLEQVPLNEHLTEQVFEGISTLTQTQARELYEAIEYALLHEEEPKES